MFIGHFAVALTAKRAAPGVSLGTLFLSVSLVDLIWPVLLLLGIEHVRLDPGNTAVTPLDFSSYPFTHSLFTSILWAGAAGVVYYAVRRNSRGMVVVALAVLSHWILDAITHRPDLPLTPWGTTMVGLGLWNSLTGTLVVELGLFAASLFLYTRITTSSGTKGNVVFWSWVVFLLVIYCASLFGPPPPDETTVAIAALAAWLFVPWGYWIEGTRSINPPGLTKEATP